MIIDKDRGRLTVELPYGYIASLKRDLETYGLTCTEFMKMVIENMHCLREELYNGGMAWDRIQEINLRIIEIQAKRKQHREGIIREVFNGEKVDNNTPENVDNENKPE